MGLTISNIRKASFGNSKRVFASVTFDSAYASGGESLTPAMLGLRSFDIVHAPSQGGYTFEMDYTNNKLKVLGGGSGSVAAHTHDLLFIGGITATEAVAIEGGNKLGKNAATDRTIAGASSATLGGVVANAAASAAGAEVGAIDLSALVVRVEAVGR